MIQTITCAAPPQKGRMKGCLLPVLSDILKNLVSELNNFEETFIKSCDAIHAVMIFDPENQIQFKEEGAIYAKQPGRLPYIR